MPVNRRGYSKKQVDYEEQCDGCTQMSGKMWGMICCGIFLVGVIAFIAIFAFLGWNEAKGIDDKLHEIDGKSGTCPTLFGDWFEDTLGFNIEPTNVFPFSHPQGRWQFLNVANSTQSMHMKINPGVLHTFDDGEQELVGGCLHLTTNPFSDFLPTDGLGPGTGIFSLIKTSIHPIGEFPVNKKQKIVLEYTASGRSFVPDWIPFSKATVPDPRGDERVATAGLVLWDPLTGITACVFFTETQIWINSDRISFVDPTVGSWAAGKPVMENDPSRTYHIRIEYDRGSGEIRWFIDHVLIHVYGDLGFIPPFRYIANRGGSQGPADPPGMKAIVFFSAFMESGDTEGNQKGLLPALNPSSLYVYPESFEKPNTESNQNFGQGAELTLCDVTVNICDSDHHF